MVGKSKLDRRGSGPLWFLALAVVLYGIFSLARGGHHCRRLRGASTRSGSSSRPSGSARRTARSGDVRTPHHWFEAVADHLGPAYLRYSFTKGTAQEVDFLVDALGLQAGMRVLDVGCGPGRHAHALASRGLEVVGVDISQRFVDYSRRRPHHPVRRSTACRCPLLTFDAEFDVAISLCQGAFGLTGGPGAPLDGDGAVLDGMRARAPYW